ncbi:virulence factor Mce family protein [Mycobacterium basiliense]|uniref:Virulence factor Mce family protein n=1 Tax=Mycobacterium basiliense TaxID=2094119 RepID=A0A447GJS2_9MYCO|nr:MCE family protein [Mycobacterium basiliense]VDM90668.1 virulence factor Mce family protein [Mycobacterium basiliense]
MDPRTRAPYKLIGLASLMALALVGTMLYWQFRGNFSPKTKLTMIAPRAGLVTDPGAKVTYNGVQIGRVSSISAVIHDGAPAAKLVLDVKPRYVESIPANVAAAIQATTVFGNKYVSLTSPKKPAGQHITPSVPIYATAVTTEFNTLFEHVTAITETVDPVKLNLTLSAAAQALSGLGDKLGTALINGNAILDEVNPTMPQVRDDLRKLATLGDIYADASPDLWAAIEQTVTTAHTLNQQQSDLDAALLAAVGLGNNGNEVFGRGGPYLSRGAVDLLPSAQLLDEYSPEIFCTIRNYDHVAPRIRNALGYNGYSLGAASSGAISGAPNPYLYPENLPRVNARGGPGGKPGCWRTITRNLWPAPYLVMDAGASIAPYNHFELGQPLLTEYVWGRQFGEYSINP